MIVPISVDTFDSDVTPLLFARWPVTAAVTLQYYVVPALWGRQDARVYSRAHRMIVGRINDSRPNPC